MIVLVLSLEGGGGGGRSEPATWSQHLPPSPQDLVTTPLFPPGPGHNTSLPPLGPGHNTSPQDLVTTPHPLGPGHNTSLPPSPPEVCAGGRYASYWNAFLLCEILAANYYSNRIILKFDKEITKVKMLNNCSLLNYSCEYLTIQL